MLSKEKIYNEASCRFEDFNHFNTFKLGATWASEQYVGVAKVLEQAVNYDGNDATLFFKQLQATAKKELDKLRQP